MNIALLIIASLGIGVLSAIASAIGRLADALKDISNTYTLGTMKQLAETFGIDISEAEAEVKKAMENIA